jgi:hypothetical protein
MDLAPSSGRFISKPLALRRLWLGLLLGTLVLLTASPAWAFNVNNSAAPAISGAAQEGALLSASSGTWTGGAPPYTYSYQWYRCTTSCTAISGATSATYVVANADLGKKLAVGVKAKDTKGQNNSAEARSTETATVTATPPANTVAPSIAGAVKVGSTLTGDKGTWSGSGLSYAYQWLRCDLYGANCSPLSGATTSSYTLQDADKFGTVRLQVTASNGNGATAAVSDPAGSAGTPTTVNQNVAAGGTLNSAPATVTVPLQATVTSPNAGAVSISIGAPTFISNGPTWLGYQATITAPDATVDNPLVLDFRFHSSIVPQGGAKNISLYRNGAEIASCYGFDTYDDSGNLVTTFSPPDPCVAARNDLAGGDAEIIVHTSHASSYNAASPPINNGAPAVSDNQANNPPLEKDTLTATSGSWDPLQAPAPTGYTYQWQRCNAAGASCVNVGAAISSAATSITRVIASGDVGFTMRIQVIAKNANGNSAAVFSAVTGLVKAAAPVNTSAPSISGTVQENQTLTSTTGVWTSSFTVTYTRQWQRCDQNGLNCVDIVGATGTTYVVQATDYNSRIRVAITATNSGGSATAFSAPTGSALPAIPVNTAPPVVSGSAQEGQTLATSNGTWTGAGINYSYQWQRCDSSGNGCTNISGATASSYVLQAVDIGSRLRSVVKATNTAGNTSASSAAAAVVLPLPPVAVVNPQISGTAQEGNTLTTDNGQFSSSTSLTYAYQWQLSVNGTTWANAAGATSSSYNLTAAEIGKFLRVIVTAQNAGGSTAATSSATSAVLPAAPANTVLPVVSGSAAEGQTLSASQGSWSHSPTSYSYQWQSNSGSGFQNVTGATSSSYLLQVADIGATFRVRVTATNAGGSASASSAATVAVLPQGPVATGTPTVTGQARDGQTLSTDNGSFSSSVALAYQYQWQTSSDGTTWADIAGATTNSYLIQSADIGNQLRAQVNATNAGGGAVESSSATAAVLPKAPVAASAPVLSGTAVEGQSLAVSNGTFTSSVALSYSYQWQRDSGSGFSDVSGATSSSYALSATDIGATLRARVTATNAGGAASSFSNASATVLPAAPTHSANPVLSGTAQEGQTLSVSNGSFSSSAALAYRYQWQRDSGSGFSDVSGATASTYALSAADVGFTLRAQVTATSSGGTDSAFSNVSPTVLPLPPVNTALPVLSGTPQEGQTLHTSDGSWSSSSAVSYAYQWLSCDSAGLNCAAISGATAADYQLTANEVGGIVRAQVTATNAGGSQSALSATSSIATPLAPASTTPPQISGNTREGSTLTAANGTWTKSPTSYSYQWQLCDLAGQNCVSVSGATSQTYTLSVADVGSTLVVVVTASNAGGSTSAASAATAEILPLAPVATATPVVSGTAREGQTLSTSTGTFSSSVPLAYSYQWQRDSGSGFQDIGSATAATYAIQAADFGATLRSVVTATNAGGQAASASASSATVLPLAPTSTNDPTISGLAQEGQTLSTTTGIFTSSVSLAYSYQWQSSSDGSSWSNIAGATASSYVAQSADIGNQLRAAVTATNAGGSASAATAATVAVVPQPPTSTSTPVVSGSAQEGQTLSTTTGSFSSSVPLAYSYQWQSSVDGTTWTNIAGATASSYVAQAADIGNQLRVRVTATNAGGSAAATSNSSSATVAAAPLAGTTAPLVSGGAQEGQTLHVDNGGFSSSVSLTYVYQWQSSADGSSWTDIAGASTNSYVVQSSDIGDQLRAVVTASNVSGSASATSNASAVVLPAAPVALFAPSISGAPIEGNTLTGDPGVWSGSPTFSYQWLACDAAGQNCTPLAGATNLHYALSSADVSTTLVFAVTATNAGGTITVNSAAAGPVAYAPPTNTAAPYIDAPSVTSGDTVTAHPGSWTRATSFSYQWQACDSSGQNCADIVGETAAAYQLQDSDVGNDVTVVVTATGPGGSVSANAVAPVGPVVADGRPVSQDSPLVSVIGFGPYEKNQTLTTTNSDWSPSATSFSFQWQRCDASGDSSTCTDIAGATHQTYTLGTPDVGATLRSKVIGTNASGVAKQAAYSDTTPAIADATAGLPTNTVIPTILGTPRSGEFLSTDNGSWDNLDSSSSYAYEWLACDAIGYNCASISGANSQDYQLTDAEVGSTIRVIVYAENSVGFAAAQSDFVGPVNAAPANLPHGTALPVVSPSSDLAPDQSVSVDQGSWDNVDGATVYSYQWRLCDAAGGSCSTLAGETNADYNILTGDSGHTLRARVTATNSFGSASMVSAPTEVIGAAQGPPNQIPPSISPATGLSIGDQITTDDGVWDGTNPAYSYRWFRCNAGGASCHSIGGATLHTYTVTTDDIGHTLKAKVYNADPDYLKPGKAWSNRSNMILASITSGDTPNAASGAPSNDDFSNAQLLSGVNGTVNGTLVGATVQQNNSNGFPEENVDGNRNSLDDENWGDGGITRSVWYVWQAPADGVYEFDSAGSPAPMFGDGNGATPSVGSPIMGVMEGTKWPDAEYYDSGSKTDPAMLQDPYTVEDMKGNNGTSFPDNSGDRIFPFNQDSYNSAGDWSRVDTRIGFNALAGHYYVIQVTNASSGCRENSDSVCPDGGAFQLNWSKIVLDADSDGFPDTSDNCPQTPNPNQADNYPSGGDGIGDACQGDIVVQNNSSYPVKFPYGGNLSIDRSWNALDNAFQLAPACAPHSTCTASTLGSFEYVLTGDTGSEQQVTCSQFDYTDNGITSPHGCNNETFFTGNIGMYNGIKLHDGIGTQDTRTLQLVWNTIWPNYAGGPIKMTINDYTPPPGG